MSATEPRVAVAHLDCTAGVAGDMLLGALLGAGAPLAPVAEAVASLGISGLRVRAETTRRGGFSCTRAIVDVPEVPDHERHLAEVLELVAGAALSPAAADFARRVFTLLAEAEGAVHGTTAEQVHFHEVGAHDSLADVIGCAAALDSLGLLADRARVSCSPLAAGSGSVRAAHGLLPVPVPAVLELARLSGLTLTAGGLSGECTTPTGAALVAVLARQGPMPAMTVRATGCGGGSRDTPDRPNITRIVLGTADTAGAPESPHHEGVLVVEATVDDLDPRVWPSVLDALRAAGAWDCWTTTTLARSGRPGQVVTALCAEEVRPAVLDVLYRHTSTLGARWSRWDRAVLPRTAETVRVGPEDGQRELSVKVALLDGEAVTVQPEYSDALRVASELGWPVRAVCEAAVAAYRLSRSTA
ncbi:uncharacterized protein (TIGR00299 family) protein [Kitasatospora sp. MAA4]|uniref:nickel pincer cofactor biosynthesis protein LarC n=1 Tax=Kitasatospora sp. MAA4 TaxID=3035093 RepID=UPI002475CE87|nr:nickel pincer cofactor biosynthesis protein LarC [Kitasatospora sp. MAA4]MDH6131748.1 uncharacterized protein (TIGR00299 family) protein [Kitasatospora sp. MAA4]